MVLSANLSCWKPLESSSRVSELLLYLFDLEYSSSSARVESCNGLKSHIEAESGNKVRPTAVRGSSDSEFHLHDVCTNDRGWLAFLTPSREPRKDI